MHRHARPGGGALFDAGMPDGILLPFPLRHRYPPISRWYRDGKRRSSLDLSAIGSRCEPRSVAIGLTATVASCHVAGSADRAGRSRGCSVVTMARSEERRV